MAQIKLAPQELINSSEIVSARFWEKGAAQECPSLNGQYIPQDNDRLCIMMSDQSHRLAEGPEAWRLRAELQTAGVAVTVFHRID
jgi:hypothetical protein